MRGPRRSLGVLGTAGGCLLLGVLFLKSAAVDPESRLRFERRLERLEGLDTRLNQDVLRARHGSLAHYDDLVDDVAALERTRAALARLPDFVDADGRAEFAAALTAYRGIAEEKERLAERFKSTNAALRNSLVYFPIAARDLLAHGRGGAQRRAVEELRLAVLHFIGSHDESDRARALRTLTQVDALPPGAGAEARLLENTRIHARNILSRRPALDALMNGILDTPTGDRIAALRASYTGSALRAQSRAHVYRILLYLSSVTLIAFITWAFSALREAKQGLEEANADLDQRVRERTRELEELNRELEVSRKQQLELKDRFLSHVSHELRTPLAAIHQFVELLRDGIGGETNDEQRQYLDLAFKNVRQLEAMIRDLTELTRAQSGKLRVEPRPLELKPLVDEILSAYATRSREQSIRLTAGIDGSLPSVLADHTRVRQVLNNLVENAFKFTDAGGRVEIRATSEPGDTRRIRISVSDTGAGIPEEQLGKVFDRLHQVSRGEIARSGLGLGLAICEELIDRHNGRIWVESELGRGSVFHFTLPVFSVAELVRPAVLDSGALRPEFGLLRVGLTAAGSGAPPAQDSRRWLAERLRRLTFYPEDVLLPSARDEDVFLVAATDAAGMVALSGRVKRNLLQEEKLAAYQVSIAVHVEPLDGHAHGRTQDEALASVSRRIETLITDPDVWPA